MYDWNLEDFWNYMYSKILLEILSLNLYIYIFVVDNGIWSEM